MSEIRVRNCLNRTRLSRNTPRAEMPMGIQAGMLNMTLYSPDFLMAVRTIRQPTRAKNREQVRWLKVSRSREVLGESLQVSRSMTMWPSVRWVWARDRKTMTTMKNSSSSMMPGTELRKMNRAATSTTMGMDINPTARVLIRKSLLSRV